MAASNDEQLAQLGDFSEESEQELINGILTAGWAQGCFLTAEQAGELLYDVEPWLVATASRVRLRPSVAAPEPRDLPHADPTVDEGFVVVNQRCELIEGLRHEPVVELVRCHRAPKNVVSEAEANSGRLLLVYRKPGEREGWVADMRRRSAIPKRRLKDLTPRQALPTSLRERARFADRSGRRYSRVPLPDEFVGPVQKNVIKVMKTEVDEHAAEMRNWLLADDPRYDKPVLLIVLSNRLAEGLNDEKIEELRAGFEKYSEAIEEKLDPTVWKVVERNGMRVAFEDELYATEWFDGYPLDLEVVTEHVHTKRTNLQAVADATKPGKKKPVIPAEPADPLN